jgi:hypothetical protein
MGATIIFVCRSPLSVRSRALLLQTGQQERIVRINHQRLLHLRKERVDPYHSPQSQDDVRLGQESTQVLLPLTETNVDRKVGFQRSLLLAEKRWYGERDAKMSAEDPSELPAPDARPRHHLTNDVAGDKQDVIRAHRGVMIAAFLEHALLEHASLVAEMMMGREG